MVSRTTAKTDATKPAKKTKSGGSGGKKKLTPFNKFMQTELGRLKEAEPDLTHKERFKAAVDSWNKLKEKPT